MLTGWRLFWLQHLGWMPIQMCYTCGRFFWAGFPGCWDWRKWRFQWMPWMTEFCSKECCDDEMEFVDGLSKLGVFRPLEDKE